MSKELTYFQKAVLKHLDPLLEKYKKDGVKTPVEQLASIFLVSPIVSDCIEDLDTRLRKLEKQKLVDPVFCGESKILNDIWDNRTKEKNKAWPKKKTWTH